jgi:hypothetical protein
LVLIFSGMAACVFLMVFLLKKYIKQPFGREPM